MMTKRIATAAVIMLLAACSTMQTMYQSPEVQQELQQLTTWAEQQAIAYFTGHIGDLHLFGVKRGASARHYSVSYVQQQAIVTAQSKYPHLTRDQIATVVQTQFQNTAAKVVARHQ